MLDRKAPNCSPKNLKINTKKKGLDGNIWIVYKRSDGIKSWKKYNSKSKKNIQKGGLLSRFNYYSLDKLSDNLYFYSGHGIEIKENQKNNIKLEKNQKIIVECLENFAYYITPGKDWHIAFKSNSAFEYLNNLNKDKSMSSNMCVYENFVPNLELYSGTTKHDPPNYRMGLYKFPLKIGINPDEKALFYKNKQSNATEYESIIDPNIYQYELNLTDLSRNRPYIKFYSMEKFIKMGNKKLFLKNIIDEITSKNKFVEFTLVLYVCRLYNILSTYIYQNNNNSHNNYKIENNEFKRPYRNLSKKQSTSQLSTKYMESIGHHKKLIELLRQNKQKKIEIENYNSNNTEGLNAYGKSNSIYSNNL